MEIRNQVLFTIILWRNYTTIFRYLLNFTNALGVKLKLLVFSFAPLVMQKVQKVERVNLQNDYKTTWRKRKDPRSVFTRSGKAQKSGEC